MKKNILPACVAFITTRLRRATLLGLVSLAAVGCENATQPTPNVAGVGATKGQQYYCGTQIPGDVCGALWAAADWLYGSQYADCQLAGQELQTRLWHAVSFDTGVMYDDYDTQNYAYVYGQPVDNWEWDLYVTSSFTSAWSTLPQIIAHELVGHRIDNLSDNVMHTMNYGSICNW